MHILTLNFALQRPQPAQAPRPSLRISPILLLHSCQLHFPFTPAPRDSAQSQPRVLSIAISSSCCCLCTRRTAGYISTCGCAYDARATWVGLRTSGRRIRRYRGRISFPFTKDSPTREFLYLDHVLKSVPGGALNGWNISHCCIAISISLTVQQMLTMTLIQHTRMQHLPIYTPSKLQFHGNLVLVLRDRIAQHVPPVPPTCTVVCIPSAQLDWP
ncbi:hypothetical protein BU26DRAFT_135886 [Trematosphaeria pertusa]|uniref:Uncharacterized protein n=1 Tax=Trematosphaeria pertusa TaxID=390896 RepID=A0A6A6IV25_9PLEO|nr:uncharacterized protein BU26DRAFT_135886 [Trematosphaeria pertusa]KAF2254294.1 hypothetical protein BU26DRAFT_135886 [Trematosphaeria pertusa]